MKCQQKSGNDGNGGYPRGGVPGPRISLVTRAVEQGRVTSQMLRDRAIRETERAINRWLYQREDS